MVHAPVVLFVSGDPHRMDCAAYPVIRFPVRRVVGFLNGTSANNPVCKQTRNPDGQDDVGIDPDGKPGLLSERGEMVPHEDMLGVYREARAVLDFNVLARQEGHRPRLSGCLRSRCRACR